MLEMLDRPLAGFDSDLVSLLVDRTRSMGIDLRVKTRVESIDKQPGGLVVHAMSDEGPVRFEADMVVHSAGRVPDLGDLNLEAAGVDHGKRGVVVNQYMQSVSNPAVYAAGDAAQGGLPLTPVASTERNWAVVTLPAEWL